MKKKKRQREKKHKKEKHPMPAAHTRSRTHRAHILYLFSSTGFTQQQKTTTSINTHHSDTESSVTTNKNHQNRLEFSPGCVRKLRAAFQFSPSPRFFTKEGKEKVGAKHAKKRGL